MVTLTTSSDLEGPPMQDRQCRFEEVLDMLEQERERRGGVPPRISVRMKKTLST
jgi:hypothetical protein